MARTHFRADAVRRLKVSTRDKALLLAGALPRSAAPFLGFGDTLTRTIPAVSEVFADGPAGGRYRMIGGDGADAPICLDAEAGGVVLLDCEAGFTRRVMNSSVAQLVRSLQAWRAHLERARREVGDKAWMEDGRYPLEVARALRAALKAVDPAAWSKGGFWAREVRAVLAEAEQAQGGTAKELAGLLGSRRLKDRRRAADQLMRLGRKAAGAEAALAKALGDADLGVRRDSAYALAKLGPAAASAAPALVRALADRVPAVVGYALDALGKIGRLPHGARKPLEALLQSPYPWIRRPAARLLRRL